MKIKVILIYIFKSLPWKLQQIIKLLITIFCETPYPHSDFPLIGKKQFFSIRSSYLDKALKFNNDEFEYYSKIYNDPRAIDTDLAEIDVSRTSIEILPGRLLKNYKSSVKNNSIFQISKVNPSAVNIKIKKKNNEDIFNLSIKSNRFISFFEESGTNIEIKSKENFFISMPAAIDQKIKHKKKMVLLLFVDGLVDRSVLGYDNLEDIMPYTAKFFQGGFDFRNHYVNSEWTLPSFASIFSGQYTQTHSLFDPHKIEELGKSFNILSQYFKYDQYSTLSIGGNPRISPSHGYVKGFDRSIYRSFMPAQEVISNFLEHNLVFNKRDQFCFLQLNDLHHNLPVVPDFSVMSSLHSKDLASVFNPIAKNIKSVWSSKNNDKKKVFIERIRRLDGHLNIIYKYLNDNYEASDISVCLTGDHGQSYLSDDAHPLSMARTKAIWLFKSGDKKGSNVMEHTEGVDIFNTILSDAEINFDHNIDGKLPRVCGGESERDFSFAQSIYPGQTYKAVINSDHGRYTYETKTPVGNNGVINHKNPTIIINQNNNTKNSFTEEQVKNIVINKIKRV